MNIIYERINELCKERGTTYNAVCKAVGFKNSTVIGNLKSRENSVLKADKLSLFANYFGVSADYILGKTDDRNADKKITATNGDGLSNLSEASEDQKELIEEILNMSPEKVSAFLAFAKSL